MVHFMCSYVAFEMLFIFVKITIHKKCKKKLIKFLIESSSNCHILSSHVQENLIDRCISLSFYRNMQKGVSQCRKRKKVNLASERNLMIRERHKEYIHQSFLSLGFGFCIHISSYRSH